MNRSVFLSDNRTCQTTKVVSPIFNNTKQAENTVNRSQYTPKKVIESSSIDSNSVPRTVKRKPIFAKNTSPSANNKSQFRQGISPNPKPQEFTHHKTHQSEILNSNPNSHGVEYSIVPRNSSNQFQTVRKVLFRNDTPIQRLSQENSLKQQVSSKPVHNFVPKTFITRNQCEGEAKTHRYFENNRNFQTISPQNYEKRVSNQLRKVVNISNRSFQSNFSQNHSPSRVQIQDNFQRYVNTSPKVKYFMHNPHANAHPHSHLQPVRFISHSKQSHTNSSQSSPPKFIGSAPQPKLFESNQLPYIVGDSGPLYDEDLIRKRNVFTIPVTYKSKQSVNFDSKARQMNHSEAISQMKRIITDLQTKFSKLEKVQQQNKLLREKIQERIENGDSSEKINAKINSARSKLVSILNMNPSREISEQLAEVIQILKTQST